MSKISQGSRFSLIHCVKNLKGEQARVLILTLPRGLHRGHIKLDVYRERSIGEREGLYSELVREA